jgi:hypothetical protein
LTVSYVQCYDDASQGLNNTKGAILKAANQLNPLLHFGLSGITLEVPIEGYDDCKCGQNTGVCLCGADNGGCGCSCDIEEQRGVRIASDTVHYLVIGRPFFLDLEAEGGEAPYSWSANDFLPNGLNLLDDGTVEGTPEASGAFRVTINVSDAAGAEASRKFSFLVVENDDLTIVTEALPNAHVGQSYSAKVQAGGGTKPYEWEIDDLPAWLQFDSSSGVLSGVPTEAAIHDITVRVKDNEGNTEFQILRLTVLHYGDTRSGGNKEGCNSLGLGLSTLLVAGLCLRSRKK